MFQTAIDKTLQKKAVFGLFIIAFFVAASLLAYRFTNQGPEERCAYDGIKIDPRDEVQFVMKERNNLRLSSITTAIQAFGKYGDKVKLVLVTDEESGRKVAAEKAYFVESRLISVPHVQNRIHAFASKDAATRHRDHFSGSYLPNPFDLSGIRRDETKMGDPETVIEVVIANRKMRIHLDTFKGMPMVVKGMPSVTVLKNFSPDSFDRKKTWKVLRILLQLLKDYMGVKLEDLQFKLKTMERVGNNWYISFWQTYKGIIIYESSFGFSIDPSGRVPAIGAVLYKGLAPPSPPIRARITLKTALEIGRAYLETRETGEHKLVAYNAIVYPVRGLAAFDYYLAYILNFDIPPDLTGATLRIGWACFVDAVTGQLIYANSIHELASCCVPDDFEQPPLSERKGVLPYRKIEKKISHILRLVD